MRMGCRGMAWAAMICPLQKCHWLKGTVGLKSSVAAG